MNRAMRTTRRARFAALAVLFAASTALTGCENWLSVSDPGAVEERGLQDARNINLMVDGVIGDFQAAYAWTALFSGVFTDELRNHHSFFENPQFDLREVSDENGTYSAAVYNGLHRARFLADSAAVRMKSMLGDSAGRDHRLARVLAYAGYTYTLLGEQYCETPLNLSAPLPSSDLLKAAVARFDEAITVATAARAAAINAAGTARADSLANFARIGAARASLGLNDKAKAIQYASAVTPAYTSATAPGFEFRAWYLDGASFSERRRIGNPFWEFITAGRWFSISGTPFENLNDPRVPHSTTLITAADGTKRIIPNSPSSFSSYDGTVIGKPFAATSSIRLASALEARYILAEAQGMTADNIAFINARRAVGGQAAVAPTTSAAYNAELREQRRRDFFLDGHRLGDLRRYKAQQSVNEFPSGSYFGSATVVYGSQECWPIPLSEKQANPHYGS